MAVVKPHIDVKLFLRASYEKAKARREARDGYATIEGFWQDPPGYVDMIVWPNYVEEHAWMFEGGDVEGPFKAEVLRNEGIKVPDGDDVDLDMGKVLEWTVQEVLKHLQSVA
jgi:nicotinamide/nicotinate riboside kinase